MTDSKSRRANFDAVISEADEKALKSCVNFEQHRFVSVERDKQTPNRYVKGHKTLRAACNHLARSVEEGEPYIPDRVIDLDTGAVHELDLIVHIAPRSVNAVGVMLPRDIAHGVLDVVRQALGDENPAAKILTQAVKP